MSLPASSDLSFLSRLPLVEIHLHLEGSIPRRVMARLARRAGRPLADRPGGRIRPLQEGRGFNAFLEAFVFCASLLRDRRAVSEAASALFADLAREGTAYAEITISPQVHLRRGLSFTELMAGLSEARLRAARRGGPEIAFVADGGRLWGPRWFEEMVREAIHFRRDGIVAVGLGGDETAYPTRAFARGFDLARTAGLGTVAHAGEGTSARSVREAVEILQVPRIGHGIAAARDPSLLAFLARRGTLLEICPTSNVMTRAVRSAEHHPLPRILESGVRVALGSDDRTIFGTTLRGEIDRAVREIGLPPGRIPHLMMNAARGAFAPERIKRELIKKIRSAFARGARRDAAGVASA